ncbi:MAG: uroporphyrinogen decarboxylase [bacterium]|nr:uroporphyrinogen decarboxylase [bacterium]
MTGRELILKALRNERTERPAWLPFVGVHGGKILGLTATEFLQSADHIVAGLKRAYELYQPDGLPIVFDLQMEAEILGCNLAWADEVPPSVVSHPLAIGTLDELPAFDVTQGRFPLVREATRRMKADLGEEVALYGLITGPFTLTSHLRGSQLFLDMMTEPDTAKSIMAFCTDVAKKTADFYLEEGVDVIAVVDPMTSQISPQHFDEFVAPYLNEVFSHVKRRGAFSSLFVCGDATRNLEAMCRTTCDNVSIDENIPLDLLRNLSEKYGKSFGGNLRLTTVLLLGKRSDAMLDAINCIDIGGSRGFILAPGCDLPYGTPEDNLQAVAEMVRNDYQRQIARTSVQVTEMESFDDLVLPDYPNEETVILDVITLDSSACAPCLYMLDAAIKASEKSQAPVTVREHKIKSREGIGYMCRLGAKSIPTICVDGEVKFASVIPDTDTLMKIIDERHAEKTKG